MEAHQHHHHQSAHARLKIAVFTASDTRTPETDESGRVIKEALERAGHVVEHYEVVPDSPVASKQSCLAAPLYSKVGITTRILLTSGPRLAACDPRSSLTGYIPENHCCEPMDCSDSQEPQQRANADTHR